MAFLVLPAAKRTRGVAGARKYLKIKRRRHTCQREVGWNFVCCALTPYQPDVSTGQAQNPLLQSWLARDQGETRRGLTSVWFLETLLTNPPASREQEDAACQGAFQEEH